MLLLGLYYNSTDKEILFWLNNEDLFNHRVPERLSQPQITTCGMHYLCHSPEYLSTENQRVSIHIKSHLEIIG